MHVILKYAAGSIIIEGEVSTPYGQWDPRINAYRAMAHNYPDILAYLQKSNISYEDHVLDLPPKPEIKGNIELYPYQQEAFENWSKNGNRGTIVIATAGGKTFIGLKAIETLQSPTLVLVPTIDLLDHWAERIKESLNYEVGVYGGGRKEIKYVTISTYDSALIYAKELGNKFNLLVLDECVGGDTLVYSSDGLKPISEMITDYGWTDLSVGCFTLDRNAGVLPSFSVRAIKKKANKVVELTLSNGLTLPTTLNHNFWTLRNGERFSQKSTMQLLSKDYLPVPLHFPKNGRVKVDVDFAWLVGYISGDGHLTKYLARISFRKYVDWLEPRLMNAFTKVVGYAKNSVNKRGDHNVWVNNVKPFVEYVPMGKKASIIEVPKPVFSWPAEAIAAYIRGWFDAEGSVSGNRASLQLASTKMIRQLQQLLLYLGISSITRKHKSKNRRHSDRNLLIIKRESWEQFHKTVGFSNPYKASRLSVALAKKTKRKFNCDLFPVVHYVKPLKKMLFIKNEMLPSARIYFDPSRKNLPSRGTVEEILQVSKKQISTMQHLLTIQNPTSFLITFANFASIPNLAKIVGFSYNTVYQWINKISQGKTENLQLATEKARNFLLETISSANTIINDLSFLLKFSWHRIVKKKLLTGDFDVYCLEEPKTNTFIANGILIGNCHHVFAPGYVQILEMFVAPYRMGLTSTLYRPDLRHRQYLHLVGGVVYEAMHDKLVGRYVAPYEYKKEFIDLTSEEKQAYDYYYGIFKGYLDGAGMVMRSLQDFHKLIIRSSYDKAAREALLARNAAFKIALNSEAKLTFLAGCLKQTREKTIIFTLYNDLVYRISRRFLIPAITYQTPLKERKEMLRKFKAGEYNVIVTSQVLTEGVDVPDCSRGIILSGTGSPREYIQRLGRLLRKREGKVAHLIEVVSRETTEMRTSTRRHRRESDVAE